MIFIPVISPYGQSYCNIADAYIVAILVIIHLTIVSYPSGNPAVIISSTEKGKYSYILQEVRYCFREQ